MASINDAEEKLIPVVDAHIVPTNQPPQIGYASPPGHYQPVPGASPLPGDQPGDPLAPDRGRRGVASRFGCIASRVGWGVALGLLCACQCLWLVLGNLYIQVVLPILVFLSLLAILFPHKGTTRIVLFYQASLILMDFLLVVFLLIDYHQKCAKKLDLWQRPLQTAYNFDCEFTGVLLLIFYIVGAAVFGVYIIVYGIMLFAVHASNRKFPPIFGGPIQSEEDEARVRRQSYVWIALAAIAACVPIAAGLSSTFIPRSKYVDGVCPSNPQPAGILDRPRINDIGCCSFYANDGVCGGQKACGMKEDMLTSKGDQCSDQFGLISCSVFRHDSGDYTHFERQNITTYDWSAISICPQWCQQLYAVCSEGKDKNDPLAQRNMTSEALNYCTNTVKVGVDVNNTSDGGRCFNSASPRVKTGVLWLVLTLAVTTWLHA